MKVDVKLVFFREDEGNIARRLIKWWTGSKYWHVEVIVNDQTITSRDDYGVTIWPVEQVSEDRDYHELQVDITDIQYENLLDWVASKKDSKYDFLGIILSQFLPARIDNPNKWFCSEIVTKVLQLMLVEDVYDLTPNMVSPGTLAKLYEVE